MLLLGGTGVRERGLALAGAIANKTGAQPHGPGLECTPATRCRTGAGQPRAVSRAAGLTRAQRRATMILVGARQPVAFFGYPNQPSILTRRAVRFHS